MSQSWLGLVYISSLSGIALFGLLGIITLYYYFRLKDRIVLSPQFSSENLPTVTIQLPIYNERFVVQRLIMSAIDLDYPHDKLQIQVVDDSDDDTSLLVGELVERCKQQGIHIEHHLRRQRKGFKAGALREATKHAVGEFVAIFDADFVPSSDFLQQTIPHFLKDSQLGMVQTRWGHLNAAESTLTAAQSIALDKHFAMEQFVRHGANMYPKFNGSGGVWRRQTLEDAGGWSADTVCEDLCLSTRAILKGWKFLFLNDVVAPAELPTTISAYKNQQARWAKGSTQCLVKYGPSILADGSNSLLARVYAVLSMAGYLTHVLLLLLLLVQVPLVARGYRPPPFLLLFGLIGLSQPLLFVMGQKTIYAGWWRRMKYFPGMLIIAIGLAPANTRAILQALFGRNHQFIRTPKGQSKLASSIKASALSGRSYTLPFDWIIAVEFFLALYAAVGLVISLQSKNFGPVLFLASCMLGFSFVALKGVQEVAAASAAPSRQTLSS